MVKILTLNINYYGDKHGTWEDRRELIAGAIRSADPDIVALQAVASEPRREHGRGQASQIAALLPEYRHSVYQPAQCYPGGATHGSAFLSRAPMLEIDHRFLTTCPDLEDTNDRVLLTTLFDTSGGPLRVFNAHFSWVYTQAQENFTETLPFLRSFEEPALLVGDFNQAPGSDLLQRLSELGWVDAWQALRPGADGPTFEADAPSQRIDYAWASPELADRLAAVEVIANDDQDRNARLSDHLGLLVTLH